MNYQDPIIGGGIASLMQRGQGDVSQPGAFEFAQKSEPVMRFDEGGLAQQEEQQFATAPQPYIGKNLNAVTSPFDWAKYGFTGQTGVYQPQTADVGEAGTTSGTQNVLAGSSKEFDDWLASQGYRTGYSLSGKKGNQTRTDYLVDKAGNVIDTKQAQVDMGGGGMWDVLDAVAAAAPMIIANMAAPGLGAALGSTLAGNAAAYGMTNFVGSGGDVGAGLKGAAMGAASGLINPYVSDAVKSTGLTGTAADALRGGLSSAAGQGVSDVVSGRGLDLSRLGSSFVSGGVGSGIGSAVNQTGLPSYAAKPITAALTSAALGKGDPKEAALRSLINQGFSSLSSGNRTQTAGASPTAGAGVSSAAGDVGSIVDALDALYGGVENAPGLSSQLQDEMKKLFAQQGEEGALPDYTDDTPLGSSSRELTAEDLMNMPGYGNLEQDYIDTPQGLMDTAGNYGYFDPASGEWRTYDFDWGDSGTDTQKVNVTGEQDRGLLKGTDLDYESTLDEFNKQVDDLNKETQGSIDLSEGIDELLGTGTGTDTTKTTGTTGTTGTTKTTDTTKTSPSTDTDWTKYLAMLALMGGGGGGGGYSGYQDRGARIPVRSPFGLMYGLGE